MSVLGPPGLLNLFEDCADVSLEVPMPGVALKLSRLNEACVSDAVADLVKETGTIDFWSLVEAVLRMGGERQCDDFAKVEAAAVAAITFFRGEVLVCREVLWSYAMRAQYLWADQLAELMTRCFSREELVSRCLDALLLKPSVGADNLLYGLRVGRDEIGAPSYGLSRRSIKTICRHRRIAIGRPTILDRAVKWLR